MVTNQTALRIPILDYGTNEVMYGLPATDHSKHGREALLQGSVLYIRRDERRNFQSFEIENVSALLRFGRLSNGTTGNVKLFRVPGLHVWALWDQSTNEFFPVSERPKFLTNDSYGAEDFFRKIAARARREIEVREVAKTTGYENIGR